MSAFWRPLVVTLAFPFLAHGDEPARVSLSGRWVLDAEKSEDGREKVREAGPLGGSRGGGGRPPGGGPGGPAGGGGPRGGRGGPGGPGVDFREALRSVTDAAPGLAITETAGEITIVEEEGRFRALHPDGKEYKGAGGQKVKTRREGGRLVVETKGDRGPRLIETYEVSGEELVAIVRLEGGRGQPLSVRRVYRRAPPEPPAP